MSLEINTPATQSQEKRQGAATVALIEDQALATRLDGNTLEAIAELKISRFLDQIGTNYPENLYELIMMKVEKPLIRQLMYRTGGNQVQSSRILGINRNTLRKKIKLHQLG